MKILVIEGWGNFPAILNQLIAPMASDHKMDVTYTYWSEYGLFLGQKFDIVIGHSLGGHAAIAYAGACKYPVKVMALDPRWMDNFSFTDAIIPWRRNFKAPVGAEVHDFYHKGLFLSGYACDGAVENVQVYEPHIWVPSDAQVKSCLHRLIG